jgi:hypothetical protein
MEWRSEVAVVVVVVVVDNGHNGMVEEWLMTIGNHFILTLDWGKAQK